MNQPRRNICYRLLAVATLFFASMSAVAGDPMDDVFFLCSIAVAVRDLESIRLTDITSLLWAPRVVLPSLRAMKKPEWEPFDN